MALTGNIFQTNRFLSSGGRSSQSRETTSECQYINNVSVNLYSQKNCSLPGTIRVYLKEEDYFCQELLLFFYINRTLLKITVSQFVSMSSLKSFSRGKPLLRLVIHSLRGRFDRLRDTRSCSSHTHTHARLTLLFVSTWGRRRRCFCWSEHQHKTGFTG